MSHLEVLAAVKMTLLHLLARTAKANSPRSLLGRHAGPPLTRSPLRRPHTRTSPGNDPAAGAQDLVELAKTTYRVGQQMSGYTVLRTQEVPENALHALFLQHDGTGAEHLHITRADKNNVFGVAFRTPPTDSTGVAHILEHTVLCGSEKYPVRDPFFNMLRRSLSTFMNAMTSSDWTMYPFSTLNTKDFQNLLSVYLDAAFFPRLRDIDFRWVFA